MADIPMGPPPILDAPTGQTDIYPFAFQELLNTAILCRAIRQEDFI